MDMGVLSSFCCLQACIALIATLSFLPLPQLNGDLIFMLSSIYKRSRLIDWPWRSVEIGMTQWPGRGSISDLHWHLQWTIPD